MTTDAFCRVPFRFHASERKSWRPGERQRSGAIRFSQDLSRQQSGRAESGEAQKSLAFDNNLRG